MLQGAQGGRYLTRVDAGAGRGASVSRLSRQPPCLFLPQPVENYGQERALGLVPGCAQRTYASDAHAHVPLMTLSLEDLSSRCPLFHARTSCAWAPQHSSVPQSAGLAVRLLLRSRASDEWPCHQKNGNLNRRLSGADAARARYVCIVLL